MAPELELPVLHGERLTLRPAGEGFDVLVSERVRSGGYGREALRVAIRWFVDERGHHRFTIDPAVENERAIRAYEAVGFRRVGVLHRYERGPDGRWRDGLLMELVLD